jgi:surface antigen
MRRKKGKTIGKRRRRQYLTLGRIFSIMIILAVVSAGAYKLKDRIPRHIIDKFRPAPAAELGKPLDDLNGVYVYYNGHTSSTRGRSIAPCGYNLGLKYQCVEFVKRYYYQHFNHKMPNSYGHAKSFFNPGLKDGQLNRDRNLLQFTNPSKSKPEVGDIIVFRATQGNPYGHVAIVSKVGRNTMEIIHQNAGPNRPTRLKYDLKQNDGKWKMESRRAQGWLRMRS